MIPASAGLWLTAALPFEVATIGAKVCGPTTPPSSISMCKDVLQSSSRWWQYLALCETISNMAGQGQCYGRVVVAHQAEQPLVACPCPSCDTSRKDGGMVREVVSAPSRCAQDIRNHLRHNSRQHARNVVVADFLLVKRQHNDRLWLFSWNSWQLDISINAFLHDACHVILDSMDDFVFVVSTSLFLCRCVVTAAPLMCEA